MEMNFRISHDLIHISILSSIWHFPVYFWLAQALLCISTASSTFETQFFVLKNDKEGYN